MLHSIILGTGQPLLILHGFLGMADNWKTLGKNWSQNGYQVHLIDQRNHGRSFHSPEFNYKIMAQDIKDYCQQHDLKNIDLIGHSMGGKVAMQVAALYPELIHKLIIADIAPKTYAPHHSEIIHALRSVDFSITHKRKDVDDQLALYIKDDGTRQFLMKSLYRNENKSFDWRFNLDILGNSQDTIGTHDPFPNTIHTPTLFVRGGDSGYILDQDMISIDVAFAKANLETIANAGHWLHAQQPYEFYKKVTDFLQN